MKAVVLMFKGSELQTHFDIGLPYPDDPEHEPAMKQLRLFHEKVQRSAWAALHTTPKGIRFRTYLDYTPTTNIRYDEYRSALVQSNTVTCASVTDFFNHVKWNPVTLHFDSPAQEL